MTRTMGLHHPEALYICFEGPEGAGKSTIARRVADHIDAVLTRETGGTSIGVRLRDILHDTTVIDLDDRAEALIVAADRAQHIAEIVAPSLRLGRHVVSDRCCWSTIAYQGYGRGRDLAPLEWLIEYATNGFMQPDLVFLLDISLKDVAARLQHRTLDRFEMAGEEFHERVRQGYLEIARSSGGIILDATMKKDDLTKTVIEVVEAKIQEN